MPYSCPTLSHLKIKDIYTFPPWCFVLNSRLFTMQLHDQFESLDAARNAIKAYVLNEGESFKTVASNKKRYIIKCKDTACGF
jgi:hypothetical protein